MRVDRILEGGTLLTMDLARPRATALAVLGTRIVAVGDGDELRRHLSAERVVSLEGCTVVPGFHDAHNHMPAFGMGLADIPLSSPPVGSVEDILRAVKGRAASQPAGTWVIGSGYDQNKLAERRHPRAAELDAAAPDHLVWLRHNSGHMCVVGGRVLDAIGIDGAPVPEGGVVERDAAGRPTGLLQEQAQALVRALVYPYPQAELVEAIARASEHYLREGLTSVQEAGVGAGLVARSPLELSAWQEARRQGRLGVRSTLMVAAEALHDLPHAAADGDGFGLDLGIRTGWGDEWLRIGAMKIFSDGSLIGRTAAMCCDFEGEAGNRGFFQMDVERLRRTITRAHRAGWQVATHAIGDRAVATVLDIYRDALAVYPRPDHRHRIEHCGVCRPEDVARLAALGVIPVPQGRFIGEIGDGMLAALGPERSTWCYRQRSFLEAGLAVPGSSDRPVVKGAPLLGIHDMVNQRTDSGRPFNPAEAVTPEQALRCYTLHSARACFRERDLGSLEAGKLADFAVLSADPTSIAPERIGSVEVLATVVGGVVAHDGMGLA
ncbi:MAG TPA: amidohydrolase [Candidatus Methylomirabilis sp.]|nr:amidohydrolase [Candidatus Methylomirabilis sp.]